MTAPGPTFSDRASTTSNATWLAITSPKVHPDRRTMVRTASWRKSGFQCSCRPARRRLGIMNPAWATTPAVVPNPRSRISPRWASTPPTDAWRTVVPKTRSTAISTTLLAMGVNMGAPNLRRALSRAVPTLMNP